MNDIWIVSGNTGEYSDFRMWHVRAFLDKEDADKLCAKLNKWCKKHRVARECPRLTYDEYHAAQDAGCPLDDKFACDYTGTGYEVWSIPVEGLSDAFIENMGDDR